MNNEINKNPELDLAPLSLAHEHARCASVATKTNNVPLARDQHVLAAGEFAKAAESAASLEALRTLKLLEDHHKHMSELIKELPNRPRKIGDEGLEVIAEKETHVSSAAVTKLQSDGRKSGGENIDVAPVNRRSAAKPNSQPRRPPSRELSSSIASNLATARGIRSGNTRVPVSPSISTQHVPGSLEQPVRRDRHGNRIPSVPQPQPGKPSWVPPVIKNDTTQHHTENGSNPYSKKREGATSKTKTVDTGFEKFYGMAEALMNKISAPLAYAGLPLTSPSSPEPQDPKSESQNRHITEMPQNSEPDLTKYISRAALRAVGGGRDLVNDSFYVVPSTGLTTSYAGIMRHAEKEKRREADSPQSNELEEEDDQDDFVDARETFSTSGRGSNLKAGGKSFSHSRDTREPRRGKNDKVLIEELEIKNEELRRVVDTLTKRLHVFETSAQRSSLALHESIRYLGGVNSPVASLSVVSDKTGDDRIRELEVRIGQVEKERDGERREKDRAKETVRKYREKWEVLKKGAKERRAGGGSKDGSNQGLGGGGEEGRDRDRMGVVDGGGRDRERQSADLPGRFLAG